MTVAKLLAMFVLVALAGCLPILSLHPLHNPQDVAFDQALVGTWVNEQETIKLEFSTHGDDPNAYSLVFSDDQGRQGLFEAHLLRLDNRRFINFVPAQLPGGDDAHNMPWPHNAQFILPGNSFVIVDSLDEQLVVRLTDNNKFSDFLLANPDIIEYQQQNDRVILTAQTDDLQHFALEQADTENLFANRLVLQRPKQSDQSDPEDHNDKDESQDEAQDEDTN